MNIFTFQKREYVGQENNLQEVKIKSNIKKIFESINFASRQKIDHLSDIFNEITNSAIILNVLKSWKCATFGKR